MAVFNWKSTLRPLYRWQKRRRKDLLGKLQHHFLNRRVHVFGTGAPKTGTTTLANLLGRHLRARHEPGWRRYAKVILRSGTSYVDDPVSAHIFEHLDRHFFLEANISNLNHFFLPIISECFPDTKLILTVRAIVPWLDSMWAEQMAHPNPRLWDKIDRLRFDYPAATEAALAEAGVHWPLAGYLRYWANCIDRTLDLIPTENLLILRTESLDMAGARLARFLNIPEIELAQAPVRSRVRPDKVVLSNELERRYLESQIQEHCGQTIERLIRTHPHLQPESLPDLR
ncbi:MAG: hypothetical protein IGQ88_11585 [Gloeomargaritaceae cyanobacterium C42_A2020_066]|nr:hypothetical protein [Gloeomargaritaceae cyanobacterium C42_A2020_066]